MARHGAADRDVVIEWRALVREDVGAMIDKPLVRDFPLPPIAPRIRRRNRTPAIGYWVGWVRHVLSKSARRLGEGERSVRVKIEARLDGLLGRPHRVRPPSV